MASRVVNLMALAFPVFKMDRFDKVKPTFSESSLSDILRRAIITSKFTIIGMAYTINSFSDCSSMPLLKIWAMTNSMAARNRNSVPPFS